MNHPPRISVIVASVDRASEIADLLIALQNQTRKIDNTILSVVAESDLPPENERTNAKVLFGPKGSCAQRNTGIDFVLEDSDYLVFFDDDYIPAGNAIERILDFFERHPDVAGVTGHLIADGIDGPGIKRDEALKLIEDYYKTEASNTETLKDLIGLYGCNMAFRASAIGSTRFDENLPLYGWQEDVDFAQRIGNSGRLVGTNAFAGVHRGTKRARSSGTTLGYSQIANVVYLMRKGTMPPRMGLSLIARNFIANHLRMLYPEPWIDRKGRVLGNWRAIWHFCRKQIHPRNILNF